MRFPKASCESIDVSMNIAVTSDGRNLNVVGSNMPGGALDMGGANLPCYIALLSKCDSLNLQRCLQEWDRIQLLNKTPNKFVKPGNLAADHGKPEQLAITRHYYDKTPGASHYPLQFPISCWMHSHVWISI